MAPLTRWHVWNPSMPVLGKDRLGGRRERRIGEGAHGNRQHSRFARWLPVHRRSAARAEVEGDRIPAIRSSSISLAVAGHRDVFTRKEGGDPVGAARSPLALETMAQRNASRIAGTARCKLPANACCNPCRHQDPRSGLRARVAPLRGIETLRSRSRFAAAWKSLASRGGAGGDVARNGRETVSPTRRAGGIDCKR
jgi:hypothetical protein